MATVTKVMAEVEEMVTKVDPVILRRSHLLVVHPMRKTLMASPINGVVAAVAGTLAIAPTLRLNILLVATVITVMVVEMEMVVEMDPLLVTWLQPMPPRFY
jgi:hypothetical protein